MATRLVQVISREARKAGNNGIFAGMSIALGLTEVLPDNVAYRDLFVFEVVCPICNRVTNTVTSFRQATTKLYECHICGSSNKKEPINDTRL